MRLEKWWYYYNCDAVSGIHYIFYLYFIFVDNYFININKNDEINFYANHYTLYICLIHSQYVWKKYKNLSYLLVVILTEFYVNERGKEGTFNQS